MLQFNSADVRSQSPNSKPPVQSPPASDADTTDAEATNAGPETADGISQQKLRDWAEQLSHDRYFRREAASRNLIRAGHRSIPVLVEQLRKHDLEVVKRSITILSRIAESESPAASLEPDSAFETLRQIADRGIGVKANLADSIVEGFLEQRDIEAKDRLRLAGVVIGREDQALGSSKRERDVVRIGEDWDGDLEVLPWLRWIRKTKFAVVIGAAARPEVLRWVVQVPELEALVIRDAEVTAETLQQIRRPYTINAFELRYVRLDEQKLKVIEKASIRNSLYLVGTGVAPDRAEQIRQRMPGLDITVRRGGFLGVICYRPDAPFCIVDEVTPGSGAQAAGLQANDIVIGIDDVRISRFEDLQKQVDTHIPGDKIKIRYRRENEILEGVATLGKLKDP